MAPARPRDIFLQFSTMNFANRESGLKRAKSEGKTLGRPSTLSDKQKQYVRDTTSPQTIMRIRNARP
ncbi:hypothetical protein GCM10010869_06640 [Mesorhizobium tianshanense]|nr:hypothetical protein GCM10010869_06640 [Mesorhizobium tianshanense]